jgi:hypothetical protein
VTTVFVAWIAAAIGIVIFGAVPGVVIRRSLLGILIDNRGRYSLSQLQLVLWTIVVLSLAVGFFCERLLGKVEDPLGFRIPDEVLTVLGISLGSAAGALGIKAAKDAVRKEFVAASDPEHPPRLIQIFTVEEGKLADQVIDVAKFQNFWITLLLLVAYVVLAIDYIRDAGTPAELTSLPGFSGPFPVLLGISHAGYLAGKLPNPSGEPPFSKAELDA